MLHRITLLVVALVAILFGRPSALQAQSCANATCPLQFAASVTVASSINCSVIRPSFDFGNHFKAEGTLASNGSNYVSARCTIDQSNGVMDVSFPTLPANLTRVGGSETVPITYGNLSLRLYDCDGNCGNILLGDPAVSTTVPITSGFLTFTLGDPMGSTGNATREVRVNIANAQAAGTYTAVITAQVALR